GQDLIFPHHENELAQSGALDRPMARFWTHNGFVRLNNEKMSKSLGNFFTVKNVLESFDGEVLRFLLISKHYRGPLDFSDEALKEAGKALERVYRALAAAEEAMGENEALAFRMNLVQEYRDKFGEAMDDDLNTARALGVVFDLVRALNKAASAGELEETAAYYAGLKLMGEELGLWQREPREFFAAVESRHASEMSADDIEKMIAARAAARAAKDWAEADRIRNALLDKGVVLEDKAGATTWKHA
ncbi:MAG: class I tRNA ligase family protein, partial [Candidatus Adiutrix sp.]|nr:class I tRNA ligase family protein [Candidatus Adiutrix sp.]